MQPSVVMLAGTDRQDFSLSHDRDRLSGVALKAFKSVVEAWELTGLQAAGLLDVSTSTWERLKRDGKGVSLSQDQLTRISALIGIYKALHLLFADSMADRWPHLENKAPLFAHASPIAAMLKGGIPLMLDVRRYVDAIRGGL